MTQFGLAMGVKLGGNAAKSVKNTHFLAIKRVKISQKIGLLDLMSRTQFKKEMARKNIQKVWAITTGFISCDILCLNTMVHTFRPPGDLH